MVGMVAIRAFCPECCEELDVQLARVLGGNPEAVDAPGACHECGSELVLRGYDASGPARGNCAHSEGGHELCGFAASPFAPYWAFVCSCGWRTHQACETRDDAATAWARHVAASYQRGRPAERLVPAAERTRVPVAS
jgi:hypothetical protein